MKFLLLVAILAVVALFVFRFSARENEKQESSTISIGFMGDTMIGRLVNEVIKEKGHKYAWGNMLETVQSVDLSILNLETTLTKSEKKVPKVFNFKSDPDHVKVLQIAEIDMVTLANNHILDFNMEGLQETIQVLNKANIQHVGAGMNEKEAKQPVIIEKKGIKIGVIGCTDNEPDWIATPEKPGTNYIQTGDITAVQKIINPLREKVDIVIVSLHWGPNMKQQPSETFVQFAHDLIDSGVDIVHGHSAHIAQGIEIYKNKLIMYDTGDFIDDYAVDKDLRNDLSFFFQVTVSWQGIQNITLFPVQINNMQVNKATGKNRQLIIDRMKQLSAKLGTQLTETESGLSLYV
jgi:poly-gamma-glutamate capsule biosynthesis protein CapA/YwtB (metallophosphatase superfamily)